MSAGEIIALVAVVVFALLVGFLVWVLLKLGRLLDETTRTVVATRDQALPVVADLGTTVTQVNDELVRVDALTANVQSVTGNVSALTSLFSATLGGPVVKTAAFTYAVRGAVARRRSDDVERRVRSELKTQRRGER